MFRRWSLLIGWLVAACTATPSPPEQPTTQSSPTATALPPAATVTPTVGMAESPAPRQVTLRLWMMPDFAPNPDSPAGALFLEQLDQFAANNPGVSVEVRTKGIGGEGGMIDSMRTASAAAPGALPDVIAVGLPTLTTAARDGLLLPLDDLLAPESVADFFAFGLEQARFDGQLLGLPFASDAQVLVYSTALYGTPPATWADVLRGDGPYLFPAADSQALATVHQYLALGGTLTDANGALALEAPPLAQIFDFYAEARTEGLISNRALQATNNAESWLAYRESQAALVTTSAHTYLTERDLVVNTDATVIPTRDGNSLALSTTWYFALARTDAGRQTLALALLNWLTAPENLGAWNLQVGYLPPRSAAVAAWPPEAPGAFAAEVLAAAMPLPPSATLSAVGPPLADGVERILRGQITPPAAADVVAGAVAGQ